MDISESIFKRKSIRAYVDEPVPADVLEKIIEAGRWAPNAGAFQISVVLNPGLRQMINERALDAMVHSDREFLRYRASLPGYQPLYGAPVLILLSAPADGPFGAINAALSAQNMLLQATGVGLGSCFILSPALALNGEENRDLAGEAGIPEGYVFQCAVIVGYPEKENKFTVGERVKKGAVNTVE